ncbi:MAG: tetratricopeptide repeat protein [Treponema sp.]|nr:tetratricopeptide repeat protein [Treponema sp.]
MNKSINISSFTEDEKKFLAVFITWFADYDMYAYNHSVHAKAIEILLPGSDGALESLVEKGIVKSEYGNKYYALPLENAKELRKQIDVHTYDYSHYLQTIKDVFADSSKDGFRQEYSECITYSFFVWGICKDVDLFTEFCNSVWKHRIAMYGTPWPAKILESMEQIAAPRQLVKLLHAEGNMEDYRQEFEDAQSDYRRALEVIGTMEATEELLSEKALILNELAEYEEDNDLAKKYYLEAVKIDRGLPPTTENRLNLARDIHNLAMEERFWLKDFESAKKHFLEALEIKHNLPQTPEVLHSVALTLYSMGCFEKQDLGENAAAVKHFRQALDIFRRCNDEFNEGGIIQHIEEQLAELTMNEQVENKITLPVGEFELRINGNPATYSAKQNTELGYYGDNDTLHKPDGMYEICLDAADFKKGDVITAKILGVPLEPDTSDECTINLNGVKDGITYGLGTVDLMWEPAEQQLFATDIIDGGFKLTFNGSLQDYPCFPKDYRLKFIVAWINGDGEAEYDVISYCTC